MLTGISSFVGVRIGSPTHVNGLRCAEFSWVGASALDLISAYLPCINKLSN